LLKKLNLDFLIIFCELNRDVNLNRCEPNQDITVYNLYILYVNGYIVDQSHMIQYISRDVSKVWVLKLSVNVL